MANKAHLAQLMQGVEAWNQWREAHPRIRPDLSEARLIEANLTRANLEETILREANLDGATLREAMLVGANLVRATLQRADLQAAMLVGANLYQANLRGANFRGANFRDTDLTNTALAGADFTNAYIGFTTLVRVNLGMTRGLNTMQHEGPSVIDISTFYLSQGNIPEVFLRGTGIPEDFITYVKSLVGRPFEYYSCFISYSSRDNALAQRLYADLQNKGVRCWFAPEDLKIGDEFRSRIDESIQVYDRLLLVLSEHSVKSRWVQKEVETAFEKENKENRIVLFPIRLDEAIMQSMVGWAADIRRQRHIGDFRQWKNHDAYQKAFNRLLRDLKAKI
jgi:TIR domain/Pentapeptide repeats (8 copies)